MEDGAGMKRLNIFGCLNHLGNNYEMLKLAKKYPVKFHYLENNVRRWSKHSHRPEPTTWLTQDEFEWVTHYEPGKYDLAILHVDQQHTNPDIGKGWLYTDLNNLIQDVPKIVINHGTPMWDEFYTEDIVINGGEVHTPRGMKRLVGMKEKIGDNFMIVNSYEAVNRWGWGYPLIHGLDPNEWWDMPKEPRVTVQLSPGGLDKYYNRQLLSAIKAEVKDRSGLDIMHISVSYKPDTWDDYREAMATSLIGIYPFKDSPMPRSRTEAMLSGQCILTSKYHNADEFFEQGVDGFVVPDNPQSYAEAIHTLINECFRDAVDIGQRAKAKAQKIFHVDRYLDDLWFVVNEVANGRKPEWNGQKVWQK